MWGMVIAGFSFVALVGAYLEIVDPAPFALDVWWHGALRAEPGTVWHGATVVMAQLGGGFGVAACAAIAIALLLAMRKSRDAAALATALLVGVAASELAKMLVNRQRPWDQLYTSHGSSFPSGHTVGAAVLAISLALTVSTSAAVSQNTLRVVWIAAALWVFAMALSRTALHVHWASDTLAGALLGCAAALLARLLWFRRRKPGQRQAAET